MENAEEKKSSKLQSRKFIIWLTWLIITLGIIVLSYIRGGSDELILKVLEYFFGVSMLYLGVNVAQKYIPNLTQKGDTKNE